MTPCPGKLCHCYVLVDCQGSTHKLISFPHFPSPDDVQCPHLETIRLRILWTSNYPKVIVFLKTVNKQQEASVMSAIVDMIKVIRVSEIYQKWPKDSLFFIKTLIFLFGQFTSIVRHCNAEPGADISSLHPSLCCKDSRLFVSLGQIWHTVSPELTICFHHEAKYTNVPHTAWISVRADSQNSKQGPKQQLQSIYCNNCKSH